MEEELKPFFFFQWDWIAIRPGDIFSLAPTPLTPSTCTAPPPAPPPGCRTAKRATFYSADHIEIQ